MNYIEYIHGLYGYYPATNWFAHPGTPWYWDVLGVIMDYMSSLIPTYIWRYMEMLKARQTESTSSSFIFLRNLCSSSWEVCFSKVESTTEHTRINPPELKPPITERNSTRFNHYLSGPSPPFPTIYIQYIHLSSSITVSYLAATYAPIPHLCSPGPSAL